MREVFGIAPAPARIKGVLYGGNICLEPEFEIKHAMPEALLIRPRILGLTINEYERYKNTEFTLYSFKQLTLNTSKRTRTYETGVMIMDEMGAIIEPRLSEPAPGMRHRSGNAAWKALQKGNMASFGKAEADYFLRLIAEFANRSS